MSTKMLYTKLKELEAFMENIVDLPSYYSDEGYNESYIIESPLWQLNGK